VHTFRVITQLVEAADGGVLELVQATGDTFLIAGPFIGQTDDRCQRAAYAVVELLRSTNQQLTRHPVGRSFTAVATAGAACGSVFGASKLAFRLFGTAIRESAALLEAAPRAFGSSRNAAFASEAFRRQHTVVAAPVCRDRRRGGHGNMSLALTSRGASFGPNSSTAATRGLEGDNAVFGERLLWRVKGVGASTVASVLL
jgi:hypothetical protein